jgi:hypothetical protein
MGVASHDHVLAAAKGGFWSLGHCREASVRRLAPGDRILSYPLLATVSFAGAAPGDWPLGEHRLERDRDADANLD